MEASRAEKPRLTLFTFSHALTHVFLSTLSPLFPLIRAEFALSYTAIGMLTLILNLCRAFSGIPAGIVSDKVDRIKFISSMFLLLAIFSGMMILIPITWGTFLLLTFLYLSMGIFHPSAYSYLSDGWFRKKGRAFGIFEAGGSVGMVVAPLVAGVVGSHFGWRYVYTLWAAPAFATAFVFYRLSLKNKLTDRSTDGSNEKKRKEKGFPRKRGLSRHHRSLKTIYLTHGFFSFIGGGSISFLPLFLTDVHAFRISTAGGILALFLAGGLVGKMIGGRYSDVWGEKTIIKTGFLLTSLFLILVPFLSGFSLIVVLLSAGVAGFAVLPPLYLLTGKIRTTGLGLAFATQALTASCFGAASRALCGVISDLIGIQYIFFLFSALGFFAVIFVHFYIE